MLHTFLLKRTTKTLYNKNILSIEITALFKMGLSRATAGINPSGIKRLNLLH